METGKPGLASAPVQITTVAAQTGKRMDIQAPLMAVYIPTVPALPAQPYPQQPPAAAREPATLHLAMPPLYSKETLPFLTWHIAGGLHSQPGLSLAAASPAARPKSAGKHVCPHCGRDCMKPSVLEKHLRCHTGERPYPCTTCGISFKTQSNLYKHKRTQAHARLSSESDQSSLGSLDSMTSSRETCTSSLSLDERIEESGSMEKDAALPAAKITCPASAAKVFSVKEHVSEQTELTHADYKAKEPKENAQVTTPAREMRTESEKPTGRHLPLQRQEATHFSKQWESSASRVKSQSHESTDSGFSESSDHYPSPGSVLPDHSMDSLAESTKEHLEETASAQAPPEPGPGGQEAKHAAREQEQKTLEERISKLISENTAVVEDKQLENVRPRKTVLSKQGSIDLPMPYTYKDSFHFDMRIGKSPNVGLQRNRRPGFYSSVPTQPSIAKEHAPLTRSNSLPFSVTLLQPERSSPASSYQTDYVTLDRRGSSGQINPTGFAFKPVNQQSSTHRPLVRQTAVDCNHATDGLFMNPSVEEASTGSLSCDGDGGDISGEPSNRKFRRKKAQKFAYNKWYMYGGGTFKKLYSAEKGGDDSANKGRKCSTNPEHEVVQVSQKRASELHRETVVTMGSTVNLASSGVVVCPPDCPPAKVSLVSAVDFNLKNSQLHTSCSSLKSPLRRNPSSSLLPSPLIGTQISSKAESRVEGGRLINEEKQPDSSSQLRGSQIPSDRKKQKTDDKIICPPEMETEQNTLTHHPPSVTAPQVTDLSYLSLPKNAKHTLFTPCLINAKTLSVCTSPATSTPSAAKTSFLPKYQLKLPNTVEPESNPSPHIMDKSTGSRNFVSVLSSYSERTPPSPLIQPSDSKQTNLFISTQSQLLLPCTAATLSQTNLSKNVTSSLSVVHRKFATTTITTTCRQDYQAGLCSTSIQPSKSTGHSAPTNLPRPTAPMVANFAATPTVTTANNQTPAATIAVFSQRQPDLNTPLSRTQLSPALDQLSPNRTHASSNTPIVPCLISPFDQMQPAAQNVFHVHTPDLQICLQIISDEQLALIEPQIERQDGNALFQRRDMEVAASEVIQNKAQSSVGMEAINEDYQRPGSQLPLVQCKSSSTLNERTKPPLSFQSNPHLTEHSNSSQATGSAESKPAGAPGSTGRPHTYSNVNTVMETQKTPSDVMSTAVSRKGEKSRRSQTSEEEHPPSLNPCAEEQHLPDRRVSQGGPVSQTLSGQHKLSVTPLSPSTQNQNSMRSEIVGNESQHKCTNQGATCNVDTTNAYKGSGVESGETLSPPAGLDQAPRAACADELSDSAPSFSVNKCKAPGQLNPQASIYCSDPVESPLSEESNSSKHANMGSTTDHSSPPQEITQGSQDAISSAHPEKQLGLFPSPPSDIPAMLTGLTEGHCLSGCGAQKEPQTSGPEGTPGQPDNRDWRPKQSHESGNTDHQCMEKPGGGGVAGGDNKMGIKTNEEAEKWNQAESTCRNTQDGRKPEGGDRKIKVDSFKNSWLSDHRPSQMHSGMCESLQEGPSTSNDLHLPTSSCQTSLFNSPQPPLETNIYFSQHWESSSIQNQQTQTLCDSRQFIRPQAQFTETQNAFSQIDSDPRLTFLKEDQKPAPSFLKGSTAAGSTADKFGYTSLSPDAKTSSSAHLSQASLSAGLNGDFPNNINNVLDNNTLLPSNPLTYPEPNDYQDTKDKASKHSPSQSSNSDLRHDISNKYQSFFFSGQLHGYPPAESLSGGVRPVQSCQDYTEDTSSSDDEGKLIIEL